MFLSDRMGVGVGLPASRSSGSLRGKQPSVLPRLGPGDGLRLVPWNSHIAIFL